MCRNIKILFNFDPPATDEEIQNASIQFVRKISGTRTPSKPNERVYNEAIDNISAEVKTLLYSMKTTTPPKNREEEAEKARVRNQKRFG